MLAYNPSHILNLGYLKGHLVYRLPFSQEKSVSPAQNDAVCGFKSTRLGKRNVVMVSSNAFLRKYVSPTAWLPLESDKNALLPGLFHIYYLYSNIIKKNRVENNYLLRETFAGILELRLLGNPGTEIALQAAELSGAVPVCKACMLMTSFSLRAHFPVKAWELLQLLMEGEGNN